jgi:hypothetical protein
MTMSIVGRVFTTILLLAVLSVFGVAGSRARALQETNTNDVMKTTAPVTLAFAVPVANDDAVPANTVDSSTADELFFQALPPAGPRWLIASLAGLALFGSVLIRRGKYLHGGGNPLR